MHLPRPPQEVARIECANRVPFPGNGSQQGAAFPGNVLQFLGLFSQRQPAEDAADKNRNQKTEDDKRE